VNDFDPDRYLPTSVLAELTEIRVRDPERIRRAAAARKRRGSVTRDGRLNLLAADHPARRVTAAGDSPLAMAHRGHLLARILRVLAAPSIDGIMASMDLLEDLLLLDDLLREGGRAPLLDERLLIPSLNRGGLAGTVWELDDPLTGPSPEACVEWGMDGAKLLLRVADTDPASLATLRFAADSVTCLSRLGLSTFLEPLPVVREKGRWVVVAEAEALARLVGVAQALGESSRGTWLKLPYCTPFEPVAQATTLPILLLGGGSRTTSTAFLTEIEAAFRAGPTVRGALAGRSVLFPTEGDPLTMAEAMGVLIHEDLSPAKALERGRALSESADEQLAIAIPSNKESIR